MKDLLYTREQLKKGQISLSEVVKGYTDTISKKNKDVNALISTDENGALAQAESIQKKMEDGTAGPLAGSVFVIKDVICERGKVVSCSSNMLKNFESMYDATVIHRLKAADAILIGRANMDEFAMGSSNENSIYGPTKNPVDLTKVPGGSSGGSAAAVAANMCSISLGSDTGGSIRQPASYCGVVGLKPTYGRVSRHGLVAFASSFDSIGPFSHSVHDAAATLQVIAGSDEMDNTSSSNPVPDYLAAVNDTSRKLKVGVPDEYFGEGLDPEIRKGIQDQIRALEKEGAELVPVSLPHMKYGISTYYILATAEASSNLARYDGIRYGHRADIHQVEEELKLEKAAIQQKMEITVGSEKNELLEMLGKVDSPLARLYKKSRTEGFGAEVKRRIMLGTYVLSSGYYDAYYAKAQKVRRLIRDDFKKAFERVDVIVSPTAPTTAFGIGENLDDPIQMYLNDVYTISANLAGICGISVPAGIHSNGLPYGIQFMADSFDDATVLQAARRIELLHKS